MELGEVIAKSKYPAGSLSTCHYYLDNHNYVAYQMFIREGLYLEMKNKLLIPKEITEYILHLVFLKATTTIWEICDMVGVQINEKLNTKIVTACMIKNYYVVDAILLLLDDKFNNDWKKLAINITKNTTHFD
jgi:hypothetical protein